MPRPIGKKEIERQVKEYKAAGLPSEEVRKAVAAKLEEIAQSWTPIEVHEAQWNWLWAIDTIYGETTYLPPLDPATFIERFRRCEIWIGHGSSTSGKDGPAAISDSILRKKL